MVDNSLMKWEKYYRNLTKQEREAYAAAAGTTIGHIENHLLPGRKVPRRELMSNLAKSTEGKCSMLDLVKHFYIEQSPDSKSA